MSDILVKLDKRLNELTIRGKPPPSLLLNKKTFTAAVEALKSYPYRFVGERNGYQYILYRGVPLTLDVEGEDLLNDE